MIREWVRMWNARSWMRKNKSFLPTWHAYVGFKMKLFEAFAGSGELPELVRVRTGYDQALLDSWIEVGLAIGHMKRLPDGRLQATGKMSTYFTATSDMSIGELLVEMMELHIPALLQYPQMMVAGARRTFDEEAYARTVASTSSFIEEVAYPVLRRWIRRQNSRVILDMGCGYAGYLFRLARSGQQLDLFGIEKDRALLQAAQQLANKEKLDKVHLMQGDILAEELPQMKRTFDLVMMNNILYYFPGETRQMLIKRAASMLSERGTLTMISPMRKEGQSQPFSAAFNSFMRAHENLFDLPTVNEVSGYAKQSGLVLVKTEPLIREGNWFFCGFQKN